MAVSYTHLDVYKRQVYGSEPDTIVPYMQLSFQKIREIIKAKVGYVVKREKRDGSDRIRRTNQRKMKKIHGENIRIDSKANSFTSVRSKESLRLEYVNAHCIAYF